MAGSAAFRPRSILPTAGFKVYLVEKSPTIGGKMSQLDKTFPTNDCSMCIESPKFIECRQASQYRDPDLHRSRPRRRGRRETSR